MASNRELQRDWNVNFEQVTVAGNFATSGTSAVSSVVGNGYTVARSTTGGFDITFSTLYPKLTYSSASFSLAAPGTGTSVTSQQLVPCTFNPSTTVVWHLQSINQSGTATDLPFGAVVNFSAIFGKSSLSK